ncbi:ribonuclease J [Corynebacterium amycolatum]|uniref:ribonuclease J n=1 Tax=Corynebacterium amycolatum TaxID=43765 RepID=UPI000E1401E9|nr:ribonuclease J [Corynebacterium amycolatum]STB93647.1 ribonuclease J [Corynebacterium amycolatum]
MAEGRNRTRKVTRKAGPPSESDVAAAEQSKNSASKGSDKGGANSNGSKSSQRSERSERSSDRKNAGNAKKSQGSSNSSNRGSRGGRGGRGGNRGNNSRGGRGGRGGNRRNVVQSMQGADLTQRLPAPPKAPKDGLRVVALGGISEIGRNMTVLEYKNRLIIVDCGVLFPSSDEPGVDLILPDFSYMEDKWDRVEALVVTHGHEDHIGAIPWLLKQRADIPIIASRFTLALIQAKTQEHRQRPKVIEVNDTSHIQRGPFDLRFFNVNHSIPECLGIVIKTGAGMVVHTGDVKMDQTPPDGKPTDLPALSRYGDEGIDLFLCESTNATIPGFSGSEAELAPTLRRLIMDAKQRVIVAAFASNVYRVQAVIDAAVKAGRKVAFNGRSMIRNMRIAQELGLLTAPENTIVEMNEAARMAPHKVVLVTTGTQGEPMAALSRMARREHRQITVRDGDLIILSSSLVPGNEEAVFGVINMLAQIGATVITGKDAKVHTSGHGFAGELLFLYNAARPSNVMPIHGEWRHIRANKELAVSTGVKPENVVLAQNGVVVDLVDGRARVVGQVPVGNLYVDGVTMGDVDADVLADRAEMREGGLITVTAVIDNRTGRPLEKPRAQARGYSDDAKEVLATVEQVVDDTLFDLAGSGENNPYRMAQEVRRRTERVINQKWRRSPMVVPTIVPMSSEAAEEVTDEEIKESRESI